MTDTLLFPEQSSLLTGMNTNAQAPVVKALELTTLSLAPRVFHVAGFASDVEPADPAALLSAAAALLPVEGTTTPPPATEKKGWLHMGL